jgi:hypothetical protein
MFTNRPGDYREWRQRIMLYKKKSEINKKSKEAKINLIPDDQFERKSLETDRTPGGESLRS